jgi:hypothetical protein
VREKGLAGSFWPTPRQKLLLQAALAEGEESAGAWRRLPPELDLDEVEPGSYPLLPLLFRRLEEDAGDHPLLPRLKGMYRRTWYVNQLRLDRLLPALVTLQEAGVEPLVISGWELACRYYDDLGLRPVRGLHAFVRPERVEQSLELLRASGWQGELEPSPAALRSRHAAWLADGDGNDFVLHWRPFHEFVSPQGGLDELWAAAIEFPLGDTTARALCPSDELLNVCLSGARSSAWQNLQWLADAVVVLRAAGGEIDWSRVVAQATSRFATLRLRDALVYLRTTVGAPVPPEVLGELERVPVSRRERLAHRAGAWTGRPLGRAPESLTRYLRATANSSAPRALAQLPEFLREEWGLERRSQVPLTAARKAAKRLAGPVRAAARAGR